MERHHPRHDAALCLCTPGFTRPRPAGGQWQRAVDMLESMTADGQHAQHDTSVAVFRALAEGQQADRSLQLLEVGDDGSSGAMLVLPGRAQNACFTCIATGKSGPENGNSDNCASPLHWRHNFGFPVRGCSLTHIAFPSQVMEQTGRGVPSTVRNLVGSCWASHPPPPGAAAPAQPPRERPRRLRTPRPPACHPTLTTAPPPDASSRLQP
jgi:hypothetical protein